MISTANSTSTPQYAIFLKTLSTMLCVPLFQQLRFTMQQHTPQHTPPPTLRTFLRLASLSPASLDMISGPLSRKKYAPVSAATALAVVGSSVVRWHGEVGWVVKVIFWSSVSIAHLPRRKVDWSSRTLEVQKDIVRCSPSHFLHQYCNTKHTHTHTHKHTHTHTQCHSQLLLLTDGGLSGARRAVHQHTSGGRNACIV